MRIDHRRFHIGMSKQFLHRADVVARLQHLRRKRMPQGMRRGRLMHLRQTQTAFECALKRRFVRVMPALKAATRIG